MHTRAVTEMIIPHHQLIIARSPDGSRIRARDMRVDHDTFHVRKSMCNLNSGDTAEDDVHKEKHDDLRVVKKGLPVFAIATAATLIL